MLRKIRFFLLIVIPVLVSGCASWGFEDIRTPLLTHYGPFEGEPKFSVKYEPSEVLIDDLIFFDIELDYNEKSYAGTDMYRYLSAATSIANNYIDLNYKTIGQSYLAENIEVPKYGNYIRPALDFEKNEIITGFEVPKINYGDPSDIIYDYELRYTPSTLNRQNNFIVVDGSDKWKSHIRRINNGEYLVDIRLGLIQVAPTDINNGYSGDREFHIIGTDFVVKRKIYTSQKLPVNVIAFKGILYNRNGDIVSAGVEGVAPVYALEDGVLLDFGVLFTGNNEENHLYYDTDTLEEFDDYDWKSPLNRLLINLTETSS